MFSIFRSRMAASLRTSLRSVLYHQNWDLQTVLAFFQVILFATHNVLYADRNTRLLLRCIRSKAVLRMWAGLEVHTDKTIAAGRQELNKFSLLMAASTH